MSLYWHFLYTLLINLGSIIVIIFSMHTCACAQANINMLYFVVSLFYFFSSEFLEVGKKQPALDVLYDVIKSKKHRTWQKIHEPIMLKYLELCVDLRKSHLAKEGLYQYKNICQQVRTKDSNTAPMISYSGEARIKNVIVCTFRSTSNPWRMLSELT